MFMKMVRTDGQQANIMPPATATAGMEASRGFALQHVCMFKHKVEIRRSMILALVSDTKW